MPKLVTFNIPALDKDGKTITHEQARGYAVRLQVGDALVKFVLQVDLDGKPKYLTHYASGYRVPGSLNDIKVRHLVHWGTYSTPLTDRRAAQALIADIVDRVGAEKFLLKMYEAPVLNP